jgi:hypothetical protein
MVAESIQSMKKKKKKKGTSKNCSLAKEAYKSLR